MTQACIFFCAVRIFRPRARGAIWHRIRAVAILKLVEIENVTPKKDFVESQEDQQALNRSKERGVILILRWLIFPLGLTWFLAVMKP